jgi:hypothetical protein
MFRPNPESHPSPLAKEAYESDPRLQKIYNSIQEVTQEFPHIKRLYDEHIVPTHYPYPMPSSILFRLHGMQIDINNGQFTFIGFTFIPSI